MSSNGGGRQAGRQVGRQVGGQADGQAGRQAGRQAAGQVGKHKVPDYRCTRRASPEAVDCRVVWPLGQSMGFRFVDACREKRRGE